MSAIHIGTYKNKSVKFVLQSSLLERNTTISQSSASYPKNRDVLINQYQQELAIFRETVLTRACQFFGK